VSERGVPTTTTTMTILRHHHRYDETMTTAPATHDNSHHNTHTFVRNMVKGLSSSDELEESSTYEGGAWEY
jgi:hypothetical protein